MNYYLRVKRTVKNKSRMEKQIIRQTKIEITPDKILKQRRQQETIQQKFNNLEKKKPM